MSELSDDDIREIIRRCQNDTLTGSGVLDDEIEKLARELQRRRASALPAVGDGWQPIETAPKDGSCLLYTPYGLTYCGRFRQGHLGEPQQDVLAWRCDSSGRFADPSHWMPLPAAPNGVGREGDKDG